jgi:hypothetical protein
MSHVGVQTKIYYAISSRIIKSALRPGVTVGWRHVVVSEPEVIYIKNPMSGWRVAGLPVRMGTR